MIDQFKFYVQGELSINRQIRDMAKNDHYHMHVKHITKIPGISVPAVKNKMYSE